MNKITLKITFLFLSLCNFSLLAQDLNDDGTTSEETKGKKKRFHAGIYIGSYFANKYTAHVYDGYGYDLGGEPNNFANSFMNNKINVQYAGAYGQPDYVGQALGVQPGEWYFNESDMPVNMRYNVAFQVGLNGRLAVSDNGAILINANASKLKITGNFTITTIPLLNANQLQKTVQTCAISGGEQRIQLQAGYQHLAGDPEEKINFLVEGGLNITMAKFDKNAIQINSLQIDLTTYYDNNQPNATATPRRPGGVGFGAFAGAGFNFNVNPKTQVQFLYSPTMEQIKVEANAPYKLQNAVGLRIYYGL